MHFLRSFIAKVVGFFDFGGKGFDFGHDPTLLLQGGERNLDFQKLFRPDAILSACPPRL
jgi:hypothetical protein